MPLARSLGIGAAVGVPIDEDVGIDVVLGLGLKSTSPGGVTQIESPMDWSSLLHVYPMTGFPEEMHQLSFPFWSLDRVCGLRTKPDLQVYSCT